MAPPQTNPCPFCGGSGEFREFTAREMMFGLRETFLYRECRGCGSLHLAEVPAELARFYPANYYSFQPAYREKPQRWLVGVKRIITGWVTTSPSPVAARMARSLAYHRWAFLHWMRLSGLGPDARILDLGCGGGILLNRLRSFGFSDLTGADPYAPGEIELPGFRVVRAELAALPGSFDLIMMHHMLEHVADPRQTLALARERLHPDGRILVRLPLAGSAAHQHYGADWFNLDAPRHLAIPSLAGMSRLAERAGLQILHQGFDSLPSGFLMSENYRRNVAGPEVRKPARSSKRRMREYARRCDREDRGDAGVFVLGAG